ncbi:conserved hypothetical protein [Frankia canadensis]|uniref:DNA recombination-mediator protein A n=1 Tax=Frankia canadensis TaxID=1836972 RepID=A0A2I2KW57_9ACTN|nr:hypothetical protein [Frankia canadensis]SNQ49888.1 conserved hypothetical protein [Frankia canadensis]SOU57178.1 conserved hypothetical protein [Frankia canadensis]
MLVVGVTGHRGLTDEQRAFVAGELWRLLAPLSPGGFAGISCLADGADTVFADVVLKLGGRLISVIPAAGYRELQPADHRPEYDRLVRSSAEVRRQDRPSPDPASLMLASRVLVDSSDRIIAVWDGLPARGYGGTADVVDYARLRGRPVQIIWPDGDVRGPASGE